MTETLEQFIPDQGDTLDTGESDIKQLPHNLEAEQQLLGAMLYNNDVGSKVVDQLRTEHFFQPLHGRIYEAIITLIERGELANPITLRHMFQDDAAMRDLGGPGYLVELSSLAVNITRASEYARILYDLFLKRQLIILAQEMEERGHRNDLTDSATTQIEFAESALFKLAEEGEAGSDFKPFSVALSESLESIEAAYKRDGGLVGVTTGIRDLDQRLGGFHKTDLLILAGRPGMGKTSLAVTIGMNAARAYRPIRNEAGDIVDEEGAVVAIFSLEMGREQLAGRIVSETTRISSSDLRKGAINQEMFINQIVPAAQQLAELPLFIDDTAALTIAQLRSRCRRIKRQHGLGLVIVDYIQLMRPSGLNRTENRVQEITEITQGLKAIAKELHVPVLALSQLSRAVEQRDDKRPQLSDLRESGSIEQDADVVMFVYREAYYEQKNKPDESDFTAFEEWRIKMEKIYNISECIIAKQRHGATGIVEMFFEPEFTTFRDLDRTHDPDDIH